MIERYTLPEMEAVWTAEAKYRAWIEVELAVLETQEAMQMVPAGTAANVRAAIERNMDKVLDTERIEAIEAEVKHDVIAFLTNLSEVVGEDARFVHMGMTSSDLLDTALALQIRKAGALLTGKLDDLIETIRIRAFEHRETVMIGRSHGIHGEPVTFGFKLLVWLDELERQREVLHQALETCRMGKISGAMGTYANIEPVVEAAVCERLGLKPARISTQVIQRDVHAQFFMALALIASTLEQFAVEIRSLQRTDVLEVEEPFTAGQKGSSAMPHKRNPVSSENITGLARLVRSYVLPALENIALWHERDISHSSVERVIFPDASILLHYMLNRLNRVMKDLVIYPKNMRRNMNLYGGVVFSQRVLLTLIDKGLRREDAYRLVQRNAHAAWNTEGGSFRENLLADSEIRGILQESDIDACLDTDSYLRHLPAVFDRFQ